MRMSLAPPVVLLTRAEGLVVEEARAGDVTSAVAEVPFGGALPEGPGPEPSARSGVWWFFINCR